MTGAIQLDREGPIARVTLSSPGRLNAMSRAMWRALRQVFVDLQQSDVRCIVVRGEGQTFCAGGDISEYPDFRFEASSLRDFHENDVWGGLQAMLDCEIPLVAQIEGSCMGAGLEMASCCDIRVAGLSARFGAPIARLGFPMAPREARLVAHAVGGLTAREMLLEAAMLDATEMKQRGFLNRVLNDAEVAGHAWQSAQRLAAMAPRAARLNKRVLARMRAEIWCDSSMGSTRSDHHPTANPYDYADSAEHREGVTAFLEKRKPAF